MIVITGSRIPRTDLTAVSPVTIVKGEEFKLQGATNAEEILNQLPQVNPSQGEFAPAGATGAATVDLRGLGSARTLVLVNGHRLMPGDPRFPVPDVNSIPTSIIQRVEVLTGGAAAVYGSDAVAGVVNFILDTKIDGFKIEGEIGGYQHDNRDKFVARVCSTGGISHTRKAVCSTADEKMCRSLSDTAFSIIARTSRFTADTATLPRVTQDQRDYGACPITARIVDQRPTSDPRMRRTDRLLSRKLLRQSSQYLPGHGRPHVCARHELDSISLRGISIQRPDKRYTAGGFANFDFSDAAQAYAEVMAMKDRSVWQVGPSGDFTNTETINCDNPLLSDQQRSLICRTGNFVGETPTLDDDGNLVKVTGSPTPFVDPVTGATYYRGWLLIARRNIEGGPIQDDLKHKSIRLLGGFKGDLGRGVSYDASYLFGRVSLDRQYRNNLSITRLGRALDVVSDPSTGQPICRSVLIARELGSFRARSGRGLCALGRVRDRAGDPSIHRLPLHPPLHERIVQGAGRQCECHRPARPLGNRQPLVRRRLRNQRRRRVSKGCRRIRSR